tara:strand:+ start:123 stop:449 length:327 start_codon:yes stop_codon:yes gene_type:complete
LEATQQRWDSLLMLEVLVIHHRARVDLVVVFLVHLEQVLRAQTLQLDNLDTLELQTLNLLQSVGVILVEEGPTLYLVVVAVLVVLVEMGIQLEQTEEIRLHIQTLLDL